jgi:hypothetical protein
MRAFVVAVASAVALISGPVWAISPVSFEATPNPATAGQAVKFTVSVQNATPAHEQVWVTARGLARPTLGDLPPGAWTYECCPAETGYGPAWHYRSYSTAFPGVHSFQAGARLPGTYPETAAFGPYRATITLRII